MENAEADGNGPESQLNFIAACRVKPFRDGAEQNIGLQDVRILDALYRSSGKIVACR